MDAFVENLRKNAKPLFWISTLIMVLMMVFSPEWFWVVLPFVCTFYVQMMDWI